ncbi:MAG: hypothetical protein HRU12_01305 [Phaeodactylibacter sp.]|nr:hypothetical protein [Phaeodactylibacter sp.]
MKIYFPFVLLAAVLLSSCGPTLSPFTSQVYEDGRFSESDLKRIQFYLSEPIVLTRDFRAEKAEVVSGEIKIINGKSVEQVVIPKGTPGAVMFTPDRERLAISFERGGDSRYLIFGPNPSMNERYTLRASDWKRRAAVVTYDGRKWRAGESAALSTLMVDLRMVDQVSVRSRIAGGRRVD